MLRSVLHSLYGRLLCSAGGLELRPASCFRLASALSRWLTLSSLFLFSSDRSLLRSGDLARLRSVDFALLSGELALLRSGDRLWSKSLSRDLLRRLGELSRLRVGDRSRLLSGDTSLFSCFSLLSKVLSALRVPSLRFSGDLFLGPLATTRSGGASLRPSGARSLGRQAPLSDFLEVPFHV